VGLGGIEPPTSALSVLRSNRLSYSPARHTEGERLHDPPRAPAGGRSRVSTDLHDKDRQVIDCVQRQPNYATIALIGRRWTRPAERTIGDNVNTNASTLATARNSSGGIASSMSHAA
jgi:hypothetical protein